MLINANNSTHPTYQAMTEFWEKFRLTYEGGKDFIEKYLVKLSVREDETDFLARKEVTYCPAHAKAAINDIKNALFQRAVDVKRLGGPRNFLIAADGTDASGVDSQGNTMNSFIGRLVLPELLTMAKVGVWIDKPDVQAITRADQFELRPYIYMYRTEDIRNWAFDADANLVSLLLRDHVYATDEYGLPTTEVERYRFCWVEDGRVKVQFFDKDGKSIDKNGEANEIEYELELPAIPFVIFEISSSLLTDVADYQVAMLNLASSDMSYALKANFPFYTEQYNPNMELQHLLRGGQNPDADGTAAGAAVSKAPEMRVGVGHGKRYPKDMERPGFIHPSPEPLKASMEKQLQLEQDIRRLVNLNVSSVGASRASAESKSFDNSGLESGLSYIALELEYGERRIAQIWAWYEKSDEVTRVKYPERYSIKTEAERNAEADDLEKSVTNSPSLTFKRAAYKEAVIVRIGHKIDADTLGTILKEIDSSDEIILDPEMLYKDLENGLVSPQTASLVRGYQAEEAEAAAVAHAERLARIAISQSVGAGAGARGLPDAAATASEGSEERKAALDTTQDDVVRDKTRGDAK